MVCKSFKLKCRQRINKASRAGKCQRDRGPASASSEGRQRAGEASRAAETEGRRGLAQAFSLVSKKLKQKCRQRTNKASRASKSQREGWQGLAMSQRGAAESQRRPAGPQKQRASKGLAETFSLLFEGFQPNMPAEDQQGQQSQQKPARGPAIGSRKNGIGALGLCFHSTFFG